MTREEFSEMLHQRRLSSGVSIKTLCFHLDCMGREIFRIEKGKNSYNLQKCIRYVDAIHGTMILEDFNKKRTKLTDYNALVNTVVELRKIKYSTRSLAQEIGCSYKSINNFECQRNIASIDTLLKIADAVGFTIKIIPNDE